MSTHNMFFVLWRDKKNINTFLDKKIVPYLKLQHIDITRARKDMITAKNICQAA